MNETELNERIRQFPLDANSVVWIAGAHRGEQVQFFLDNYACEIWAFEPQADAYQYMTQVIQSPRVKLYNFGLGEVTAMRPMCYTGTLGATYILDGSLTVDTQLVSITDFAGDVDLFLVNMEGYEFILLPYMIETGVIQHFHRMMVQFHTALATATQYQRVRAMMAEYYRLIWEYGDGLWTYWEKL